MKKHHQILLKDTKVSQAVGTTQREETAIKHKPNTVLLSTQPAYTQSVKYNDTLTREFNVFRGAGSGGLKYKPSAPESPVTCEKEYGESLHPQGIKNLQRETKKQKTNKSKYSAIAYWRIYSRIILQWSKKIQSYVHYMRWSDLQDIFKQKKRKTMLTLFKRISIHVLA